MCGQQRDYFTCFCKQHSKAGFTLCMTVCVRNVFPYSKHVNNDDLVSPPCRFGVCEPYRGGAEICNGVLSSGVDYVFISKSHGSQENISQFLATIPHSLLIDDYCREQVYKIVCNYYFIPCGSDGSELPPSSICPEECSMIESTCPVEWDALKLSLRDHAFIDCNDTSALLFPLPNCCTGVGIQAPVTELG